MKIAFEANFARDLRKIRDRAVLNRVEQTITNVKEADSLQNILNFSKLSGYDTFYRIRVGDYRIGIEALADVIVFVRILHRKDIYRYFP